MERLTDDRFLKDGFYQPKSKEEEKGIRNTANDLTFEKLYKHCAEVEKQNAELQKQVDELLNRRIEPKIFHCHAYTIETCPKVQQAVKDTAKEILAMFDDRNYITENELKKAIAERYGVEVE